MRILTSELLSTLATVNGGYTKATLLTLGVEWDNVHHTGVRGWKRALLNTQVSEEVFQKAFAGKTMLRYSARPDSSALRPTPPPVFCINTSQ